jgi:hypothetical protein
MGECSLVGVLPGMPTPGGTEAYYYYSRGDLPPMSEELVRHIEGVGDLVYESHDIGEWTTQAGEPSKRSRRRYLLDGEELDSVSSIVSTLDKGDGLNYWHEDHGARGGVLAERMGELDGVPMEDIVKRVRLLKLGAEAARKESSARGTAIHEPFHHFALTGEYPVLADYPLEWRGWIKGVAKVLLKLEPEPVDAEFMVCNPVLEYAGRPDLICEVKGRRQLWDYKTSLNGVVYAQAHYQTIGYAECFAYCGIDPVDDILIIPIAEDGEYREPVKCAAVPEDWRHLWHLYHSRKRVNAAMAAQRKEAKALMT